MRQVMVTLKGVQLSAITQEVKVVERVEREVKIEDGDEVVCLVVGRARVYGGGLEVDVEAATLVEVVEVRKGRPGA